MSTIEKDPLEYGRWTNMTEWLEEASRVMVKARPAGVPDSIPVPGRWALRIYIPSRLLSTWRDAMERGMALLVYLGVRPENAYLEHGYCVIWLISGDFYEVKALAEQVRSWLIRNGYETTVADSFRPRWQEGVPAHISLSNDRRITPSQGDWVLTVMIPTGDGADTSGVAMVGASLSAALSLAAEVGGVRVGGWMLEFRVGDFTEAKAKAKQAIAWLASRSYRLEASWGDVDLPLDSLDEESLRGLNQTGQCFYVPLDFTHARVQLREGSYSEGDEWTRRLKRLLGRLTGPAENLTVMLSRPEVKVLLDLAGEFEYSYGMFDEVIQQELQDDYYVSNEEWERFGQASRAADSLAKIVKELRITLDRATR
jgi:hypothetical protein